MNWSIEYLPEAKTDLARLDNSKRERVVRALSKVKQNPYPATGDTQGRIGLGKPLGNKNGLELSGLLKIKLRNDGIRVVYKLEEDHGVMKIIVVGLRANMEVYKVAYSRRIEYGL